jgi:hypothetical protein
MDPGGSIFLASRNASLSAVAMAIIQVRFQPGAVAEMPSRARRFLLVRDARQRSVLLADCLLTASERKRRGQRQQDAWHEGG